jgi:hypothetical protein
LAKYPQLDTSYQRASIWGALSSRPLAVIWVPQTEWEALTQQEREVLRAYASQLVNVVRLSPLEYAGIPRSAPTASLVIQNASRMTPDDWGIGVGEVSNDGRDILADRILVQGQE